MANTKIWCSARVAFLCLLVGMLLFSFVTLDFEHRVMTVKYDFTITNEDASTKNGVRRQEQQLRLPLRDKDTSLVCQNVKGRPESPFQRIWERIQGKSEVPFQRVWERLKPPIMNVSLINTTWTKNIRANKNFTDWVDESMSYFTYSRLQHTSLSRPIDQTRSIGRIRSVLEKKLKDPTTAPPLRIVAFGGSVTNGHYCLENIYDFLVRKDGKGNGRADTPSDQSIMCAWSGRLQDMMDEVFGSGVVDVVNLSVGGATTDMSTALMEFGLIPGTTPDIIIWDHGTNDAFTKADPDVKFSESTRISTEQMFDKLQSFYQATLALPTTCDKPDPPMVIMLDSFLGQQVKIPLLTEALRISTAVSKLLTWYPNIWGISSANTIRPYILTKVADSKMIGLLGNEFVDTHPGMMYHISIAWVIMFNFLNALHDDCITTDIEGSLSEGLNPSNESDYLPLSYLPELHDELRMVDVPKVWKEGIPETMDYETCLEKQMTDMEATLKFTDDSSSTCFYVWLVNPSIHVVLPDEINRKIEPYLVANDGWSAYGTDRKDRPHGWIPPGGRGSFFELEFSNVPATIDSMTIIYMQSYSQQWFNATLQIDGTFYDPSINAVTNSTDSTKQVDSNTTVVQGTSSNSTIRHVISGYHEEETSVLVPIKLQLPNRTLDDVRSTLRLHFRLIDGETFKIAGIALC